MPTTFKCDNSLRTWEASALTARVTSSTTMHRSVTGWLVNASTAPFLKASAT